MNLETSLIIRAVYGTTSENRHVVAKKYTQIGGDPSSDLLLLDDGVPGVVCLIEKSGEETVLIHCQASNAIRLGRKTLAKGEVATWTLKEEIEICSAVVLRLDVETREKQSIRRSAETTFRDSFKTPRVSVTQTRATLQDSPIRSIGDSNFERSMAEDAADDGKKKKSSGSSYIKSLGLFAVAIVIFYMAFAQDPSTSSLETDRRVTLDDVVCILDSESSPSDADSRWFSFNDAKMLKDFRSSYWLEEKDPYLASLGYRSLLERLNVSYNEKKREAAKDVSSARWSEFSSDDRDKVEEAIKDVTSAHTAAERFIHNRINRVEGMMDD